MGKVGGGGVKARALDELCRMEVVRGGGGAK